VKTSENEKARKIVGQRDVPKHALIITTPGEYRYHCPVCEYEHTPGGNFDERLWWSEYNGFIWCQVCNKDYPSALCQPNIDKAIDVYLDCVSNTIELKKNLPVYHKELCIDNVLFAIASFLRLTGKRKEGVKDILNKRLDPFVPEE